MKTFFADIFEYHLHFNKELVELFSANKFTISERSIPLLSHCLNAHRIWNERIKLTPNTVERFDIHLLENMKAFDIKNHETTLCILEEYDLNLKVKYKNSTGDSFENTVREILFHVINHFTHHKGQLISDLRQSGITPPITDYIFYKR